MTTGDRIRELRKALGLTQEELGKKIGVQKAAINKYETGLVVNLKSSTISALSKALGVSPVVLLGDDSSELSPDEHQLVTIYRSLPGQGKKHVLEQARLAQLAFGEKSDPVPASGSDAV